MILGETPEGAQFRSIAEETLIENWLGELEPTLATAHGNDLAELARTSVRAEEDYEHAFSLVLGASMLQNDESNMRAKRAVHAMKIYLGKIMSDEPTGFRYIDELIAKEATFTNGAGTIGEIELRDSLCHEARTIGKWIYHNTTPGPLAA